MRFVVMGFVMRFGGLRLVGGKILEGRGGNW
jgi:hypothetical protein